MAEQSDKSLEKKLKVKEFYDIATRVLSPSILQSTGKIFDWDFDYYNAHCQDKNPVVRVRAEDELIKSAQLYMTIIDKYAPFMPNPAEYSSKREFLGSLLNKLVGPSAMWEVQPGA